MIQALLPESVVAIYARATGDPRDAVDSEMDALGRAAPSRRAEFAAGRDCARRALLRLGEPPAPVLRGPAGEPAWPPGVVGSITHCAGYYAAAVGHSRAISAIGIDVEPHRALASGVVERIAGAREASWIRDRAEDATRWDTVLFSAKESVFKAWFPLTSRWLGFDDVRVDFSDEEDAFAAHLLVPAPLVGGVRLTSFDGRFVVHEDLIFTAIVVSGTRPR
jgi:4'-phosphopantetheinyl transferase EntD